MGNHLKTKISKKPDMDTSIPVSKMTADQRAALTSKLGECLAKQDKLVSKVSIKTSRETVCALGSTEVEDKFTMSVEGSLGLDGKDQVEAFKKDVESSIGSVEGLDIKVNVMLGPGCEYDTIKQVVPIKGGDPVDLAHKEGEVWLIDFWATWCPPCQAPMAHNQEMLTKRKADWGDKLKIIAISID